MRICLVSYEASLSNVPAAFPERVLGCDTKRGNMTQEGCLRNDQEGSVNSQVGRDHRAQPEDLQSLFDCEQKTVSMCQGIVLCSC